MQIYNEIVENKDQKDYFNEYVTPPLKYKFEKRN